jgi:YidC/Oxa1 family membrane protein insertase
VKELSDQARVLIAFLLSIGILFVWSYFFAPKPPVRPAGPQGEAAGQPAAPAPVQPPVAVPPASPGEPAAPAVPVIAAAEERLLVVENNLYRITFSNRGATARSWQLNGYQDDHKPPRPLDLVHTDAAQQLGEWPLSLLLEDAELETRANQALYQVEPDSAELHAPAEVTFRWSDGHLAVTKRLKFESGYVVGLETSVQLDGRPLLHGVAWRGGFGDTTVPGFTEQVRVFFRTDGSLEALNHRKLGTPDAAAQPLRHEQPVRFGGIEDRYFAAAFLPPEETAASLALWHWKREHEFTQDGKKIREPVVAVAAGPPVPGPFAARLFVGPKQLDVLNALRPPLGELVDFGWFSFLAVPLFYSLQWIYGFLPNYGWAIVLMTFVINMLLFPLKVKSFRSMQKMQKVMPQIKAIKEKYKKYPLRDPRRQQEQQEMMALWKREGINPTSGCLPMLLQMPIWVALFRMLNTAIELRHAPWVGWIRDLSAHDPYYILPIAMTVTMYMTMATTPSTSPDPAQQRLMKLMPLMMGFFFLQFASGLVLYILTSNLVGMAQQWYLNRTMPPPQEKGPKRRREREKQKAAH